MDDGGWSVRWSVIPWWAKMCAMAKTLPTARIRLKLPVLLMAAGASFGGCFGQRTFDRNITIHLWLVSFHASHWKLHRML